MDDYISDVFQKSVAFWNETMFDVKEMRKEESTRGRKE